LKKRYNEMKRLILSLFQADSPLTSHSVAERLRGEQKLAVSLRSVQMAMMRYHRQGLLHRERHSDMFLYSLTEKGSRRLRWLQGNKEGS
jgi:DNA-binding transcriptional regulator PaaX